MSIKVNSTQLTDIKINSTNLTRVTIDGVIVFQKKLAVPTTSHDSDSTCDIRIDNPNNVDVTAYASTTRGGTTYSTTISANSYSWLRVGSWDTTYYVFLRADGWEDSDITTGTAGSKPMETLTSPSLTASSTTRDITVKNNNSTSVTVYYSTSSSSSGTNGGTISANSSKTITMSSWETTYYFYFTASGWNNSSRSNIKTPAQPRVKLTAPVTSHDSDSTCDIKVQNNNSVSVTVHYSTTRGSSTYTDTISANDSKWIKVSYWDTTYYFYFTASGYDDSDIVSGTAGSEPYTPPTPSTYTVRVYANDDSHNSNSYTVDSGTYVSINDGAKSVKVGSNSTFYAGSKSGYTWNGWDRSSFYVSSSTSINGQWTSSGPSKLGTVTIRVTWTQSGSYCYASATVSVTGSLSTSNVIPSGDFHSSPEGSWYTNNVYFSGGVASISGSASYRGGSGSTSISRTFLEGDGNYSISETYSFDVK